MSSSDSAYDSTFWTIDSLNPGQTQTLTVTATINNEAAGNSFTQNAQIYALVQSDPISSNNYDSVQLTVPLTAGADIDVNVGVSSTNLNEGDVMTFYAVITNDGPGSATDLTINVPFPAQLTLQDSSASTGSYNATTGDWTLSQLDVDQVATLSVTTTVNAGTGDQSFYISAQRTASTPDDPDATDDSASRYVTVSNPNSTIDLSAYFYSVSADSLFEGDTLTFYLEIYNTGPQDATGVEVTINAPAQLTLESGSPDTGSFDPATGVWTLGDLAAGDWSDLYVTASVNAGTAPANLTVSAEVTAADQPDINSTPGDGTGDDFDSFDVSLLDVAADLSLTVNRSGSDALFEGSSVTMIYEITNAGPDDTTGVSVTTTLPAGLTDIVATPSQGSYDAVNGIWTLGSLATDASATLSVTATIDTGTASNYLYFYGDLATSDLPDPEFDARKQSGLRRRLRLRLYLRQQPDGGHRGLPVCKHVAALRRRHHHADHTGLQLRPSARRWH